jgi:hypothetical protein
MERDTIAWLMAATIPSSTTPDLDESGRLPPMSRAELNTLCRRWNSALRGQDAVLAGGEGAHGLRPTAFSA